MSNPKKYPLSMNGDAFNAFKSDFDQMLRKLLMQMEEYESEEAVINMKMTVSLAKDQERDFEANGYDAMKDITKPTFKHDISTIMQIKDKKSGTLGGSMKLVWDKELHQYVMQEIDNGQTSMFDDEKEPEKPEESEEEKKTGINPEDIVVVGGELPPPKPQLPPPEDNGVIDADYTVVDGEEGEGDAEPSGEEPEASDDDKEVEDTPFGFLLKYVGKKMRVVEAAGNVTVRTVDENKVILSSAYKAIDPFYVTREKLLPHVGHSVVCVGYGEGKIVDVAIECENCNEVLFDLERPQPSDLSGDYPYENPA